MIEIFFLSVGTVEEVHDHLQAAETGTIMYMHLLKENLGIV